MDVARLSLEQALIGEHSSVVELRRLIARVAASAARSVIIYGETGTGKGVVARAVHRYSNRRERKFIDLNCAAIPDALMESELFGHEKGAFTGAVSSKPGLIEFADGGTVFLDEIREMNAVMQAKLLTVLDTQQLRRVGATQLVEVDVRFIVATNQILFSEVKAGRFRDDLYYRLQVVPINVPPLRDRGEDVLVLTDHFLRRLGERYQRVIRGLEPAVKKVFLNYTWPGNVRELENLLERIFILEDEDRILIKHIPERILRTVTTGKESGGFVDARYHEATAEFQRQIILDALQASDGAIADAACRLGLTRHALRHQMLKLGIAPPSA
jgi:two-component system response regulator AtoC